MNASLARIGLVVIASAIACAAGCGTKSSDAGGTTARMSFDRPDFYAAPFPSDDLLAADGTVNVAAFPNPYQNILVEQLRTIVARDARGFATTAGVFFTFTDDLDPSTLPDLAGSIADGASVAIVSVDPAAPDFGKKYPAYVTFAADGGDYGALHQLSIVPLAGVPLRPKQKYAAFVTSAVKDVHGAALRSASALDAIRAGKTPAGMNDATRGEYADALSAIAQSSVDASAIVALSVFTTGDPTSVMLATTSYAVSLPAPALTQPITKSDTFDGFCVYNTQLSMPDYQSGTPPYSKDGGDWAFDAAGHPIQQRLAPSRIVITIPRAPMPADGYPIMVLVRTGAGGDRPLVDRGVQGMTGGPALTPGTGPGSEIAKVGWAGAEIDGPHGGLRNVTNGDEQFLMFNVSNGFALRDNVRETALEIAVFERVLQSLTFDASDCAGASKTVKLDPKRRVLMGHSMGATVSPLALAVTPVFQGAVLSGAGASWIENVLFKKEPLAVRPILEALFGYSLEHRTLTRGDPILSLLQWAIEPADPLVYDRLLLGEPLAGAAPRQILMEQGIVDHYILPPIANATSLSLGLDLAGTELDTTNAELMMTPELTPLANVMQFSRMKPIAFPVSGNYAPGVTAIVVQHPSDGIEDGHEVMFQTAPPKNEYRCFLQSIAKGGAASIPDGSSGAGCP